MPKALEDTARRLRMELEAVNSRLEDLSRREAEVRRQAANATGSERAKLMRDWSRLKKEWDSLYKRSMDIGIRLARVEEALRKGGV